MLRKNSTFIIRENCDWIKIMLTYTKGSIHNMFHSNFLLHAQDIYIKFMYKIHLTNENQCISALRMYSSHNLYYRMI